MSVGTIKSTISAKDMVRNLNSKTPWRLHPTADGAKGWVCFSTFKVLRESLELSYLGADIVFEPNGPDSTILHVHVGNEYMYIANEHKEPIVDSPTRIDQIWG
jgi:hypothetical protein